MRLRFIESAAEEFLAATRYYDGESPSLGASFVADVERTVSLALSFPEAGSPGPAGTRRLLLRQFPFSVVYRSHGETLQIVAVAHQSREPGYWVGRTGP